MQNSWISTYSHGPFSTTKLSLPLPNHPQLICGTSTPEQPSFVFRTSSIPSHSHHLFPLLMPMVPLSMLPNSVPFDSSTCQFIWSLHSRSNSLVLACSLTTDFVFKLMWANLWPLLTPKTALYAFAPYYLTKSGFSRNFTSQRNETLTSQPPVSLLLQLPVNPIHFTKEMVFSRIPLSSQWYSYKRLSR